MSRSQAHCELTLDGLAATEALAGRLAPLLGKGDAVALYGDLGAGKTAFARALIRARAGSEIEVPSPTYTLMQEYLLPNLVLNHFDLYRLKSEAELAELGLEHALENGAVLVEWPELALPLLPADRLSLRFTTLSENTKRVEIDVAAGGRWAAFIGGLGGSGR